MRPVVWLFRAALFFALFAFALNNQHPVAVHWFFGLEWHTPLVIVVLLAFALGAVLGVLAMVPSWWRARRSGAASAPAAPSDAQGPPAPPAPTPPLGAQAAAGDSMAEYPPRIGP
ncbi:MAG: LapA family protein [Rubrivivax sp.]|nr:LapA family protein [Rubrivivax sp.]